MFFFLFLPFLGKVAFEMIPPGTGHQQIPPALALPFRHSIPTSLHGQKKRDQTSWAHWLQDYGQVPAPADTNGALLKI